MIRSVMHRERCDFAYQLSTSETHRAASPPTASTARPRSRPTSPAGGEAGSKSALKVVETAH
jgi:hypothetical protein